VKNKGNNIAKKGDSGWEESYKWNKYSDKCGHMLTDNGDYYLVRNRHYSTTNTDYISLVSTSGFKNTGLNNGENHLKCFYTSGTRQATSKTSAKAWTPDFDGDGESLVGWTHTGVAQRIDLKNSHL